MTGPAFRVDRRNPKGKDAGATMDIEFQRAVDHYVGWVGCRLLSMLPGSRREPSPDAKPRRILVILLTEMGSLVLAVPMFERLKRKYPDAPLFALVFEQNREVLGLLDVVPEDHILTVRNTTLPVLAADSVRALGRIRAEGIDTVIDCELFSRISSIYSYLSGASLRAGFHRHTQEGLYRGSFINRPVLYNPYVHISRQFVNLLEALEPGGYPRVKRSVREELSLPPQAIPEEEIDAMSRRLAEDFPCLSGKPLVLMNPGGGLLPVRAWPMPYFVQLVDGLTEHGYPVGIIGLARDREIAREIQASCKGGDCVDLTGYTKSIRELIALFHLSSLLVSNDGGPCHFASMTPVPAILFFGPETPVLYGPLGGNASVFHTELSCSPCLTAYNHRVTPCDGDNVCLKTILPETVLRKALELLGRK
jgi:ADP-heptose:LPS heptosyltransferase